jgi:excisionase family DNA binding protein
MNPELTPLKTAEEAAPYIGLTAKTLLQKAKQREIQHTRPLGGKLIRFSDDDIAAIRAASVVLPEKPALTVVGRKRVA